MLSMLSMCLCPVLAPVNAEHDEHVGGEDEAARPHHHQNLAHEVAGVPLNTQHYVSMPHITVHSGSVILG